MFFVVAEPPAMQGAKCCRRGVGFWFGLVGLIWEATFKLSVVGPSLRWDDNKLLRCELVVTVRNIFVINNFIIEFVYV